MTLETHFDSPEINKEPTSSKNLENQQSHNTRKFKTTIKLVKEKIVFIGCTSKLEQNYRHCSFRTNYK